MSNSERAGKYIQQTSEYKAFIPAPLPPNPPLKLDGELLVLLSEADRAIGHLDSTVKMAPGPDFINPEVFARMYSRNEAVYSSKIEGTRSTLVDLLEYETRSDKNKKQTDAAEVHNYVRAMNYGLERLEQIPLSLRVIKEIHAILLEGVRGSGRAPGEFRRNQVFIGAEGDSISSARYIPPPPNEVISAMGDIERFMHDETPMPILVKCGLIHAQFEMIHPFLDGNGRVGRLLVTFMLCWSSVLKKPLLNISDFFMRNRTEYYKLLSNVSNNGEWESWIEFFLTGVKSVSLKAVGTIRKITLMRYEHRELVIRGMPKSSSALELLDYLYKVPYINSNNAATVMGVSQQAANKTLRKFEELGLLVEKTGQKRNREYAYQPYLNLFD